MRSSKLGKKLTWNLEKKWRCDARRGVSVMMVRSPVAEFLDCERQSTYGGGGRDEKACEKRYGVGEGV